MMLIYILVIFIFITTFTVLFLSMLYRDSKRHWLKAINKNPNRSKNYLEHLAHKFNRQPNTFLLKIFDHLNLKELLQQSGFPFGLTLANYLSLYRFWIYITFLFVVLLFLLFGVSPKNVFAILSVCFLLLYLPIFYLKLTSSKRIRSFNYDFNNFIDMVSLAVEAGMNFEQALFFTTKKFDGVLFEEFQKVKVDLTYGYSLEKSLENLTSRINSRDLQKFTTAIKQATFLGTPLSQILRIQSKLILTSRIQRAEELSRTASVKISIPLVFFIFPALLILYLVPAILQFVVR